jgi:hypothetical protein
MSENVGASTSRNPKGIRSLYRENFTLAIYVVYSERSWTELVEGLGGEVGLLTVASLTL